MADYDKTPSYAVAGALGLLGKKPVIPEAPYVDVRRTQEQTLNNVGALLPEIKDLAKRFSNFEANQLLKSWEKLMPGFGGLRNQATGLASSFMKGEIPADVLKSIQDAIAAASAGQGTAGSSFQFAQTAKSYGDESTQLVGRGLGIYNMLGNMFMPYAPLKGFAGAMVPSITPFTAGQTYAAEQWNATQKFNTQLMKNIKDAMPSPAQTALANAWGQIDADIQDFFKTAYGGAGASKMGSSIGAAKPASKGGSGGTSGGSYGF